MPLPTRSGCVLLAQTRVGFLSGGAREKSFHQLPSARNKLPKKKRPYARATVAPHPSATDLLHHGPTGRARTGGSRGLSLVALKYGASFSGLDDQDDPVFLIRLKDEDLLESPDDSAFLQSLRFLLRES